MKHIATGYFNLGALTREQLALSACVVCGAVLINLDTMKWVCSKLFSLRLPWPRLSFLRRFRTPRKSIRVAGIEITDLERMMHAALIGTTGTGKSVLMEQMMRAEIERGNGLVIIDAKGDRKSFERLRLICESAGRGDDLHLLSATHERESERWNPCRLGSKSELVNKFYASCKYEHSHFGKAAVSALNKVFGNLDADKVECLYLSEVVAQLGVVTKNGSDEHTKGLYFDFLNLSESEWAGVLGLTSKEGNQKELSFLDVIKKNEILYISLPTEGKQVESSRLGALILQELTLISGMRKSFPDLLPSNAFPVFVDEFDAFATDPFISILNKGRSSGFMFTLAFQTLSDLKKVSDTFEAQVMGNCNIKAVFRLNNSDDAEKLARDFGTRLVKKYTHQTEGGTTSGKGTERETQEFNIHPDKIKSLPVGECVLSIKDRNFLNVIKIPFNERPKPPPRPKSRSRMGVGMVKPGESENLETLVNEGVKNEVFSINN